MKKTAFLLLLLAMLCLGGCAKKSSRPRPQNLPEAFTTIGYKRADGCTLRLDRAEVPGGWLYVTTRTSGDGVTSVFVPDPARRGLPEQP